MLLLSRQSPVSIDFSPLTKIHQSRCAGPPFPFLLLGGGGGLMAIPSPRRRRRYPALRLGRTHWHCAPTPRYTPNPAMSPPPVPSTNADRTFPTQARLWPKAPAVRVLKARAAAAGGRPPAPGRAVASQIPMGPALWEAHAERNQVRSGQVRYRQPPPSVNPLRSVRLQDVWPNPHAHALTGPERASAGREAARPQRGLSGGTWDGSGTSASSGEDRPREKRPLLAGPGGGGPLQPIRLNGTEPGLCSKGVMDLWTEGPPRLGRPIALQLVCPTARQPPNRPTAGLCPQPLSPLQVPPLRLPRP